MMIEHERKQWEKGKQYTWVLLFCGLAVYAIPGLLMHLLALHAGNWLYRLFLIFVACYIVVTFFYRNRSTRMALLKVYLASSSVLILLVSSTLFLLTTVTDPYFRVLRINLPSPMNYIAAFSSLGFFVIYFIKKFREIDIVRFRQELKRKKMFNTVNKTFFVGKPKRIIGSFYRKKVYHEDVGLKKKLKELWYDFLSWIILIGYYGAAPFSVTASTPGEMRFIAWIMLFFANFFAYVFAIYGIQQYYAYYRVYRQIEKEIGAPLTPTRE